MQQDSTASANTTTTMSNRKHNNERRLAFRGAVFDLDGVVTQTAHVHFQAWKQLFDDFLNKQKEKYGGNEGKYREFTREDYLAYVDGMPRFVGVATFLKSRGIELPYGSPSDENEETIYGLGNRKNQFFVQVLAEDGAKVYESTVRFIHQLKDHGVHVAVASSSANTTNILKSVFLDHLFEAQVDGKTIENEHLHGKPDPDMFLRAVDLLNSNLQLDPPLTASDCIVVEDAVSGVQAGSRGNFGLVIGVDRGGNREALQKNGADVVISDFNEVPNVEVVNDWFRNKFSSRKP